jgi:hypothetical protein
MFVDTMKFVFELMGIVILTVIACAVVLGVTILGALWLLATFMNMVT